MPIARRVFVHLASPAVLAAAALGQCDLVWGSASPRLEVLGAGSCSVLWDPDGAGPAPLNLVVGGTDLVAGAGALPGRVAAFDGSRWTLLGNGPATAGSTHALAVWNGQLIAGGTLFGGGIANIAAWNGSGWQPLGPGFPTNVTALTVWNGNLVAGGTVGTTPLLQLWNGSVWTPLPSPPTTATVLALTTYLGQLVVGGSRPTPQNGVLERWNGTSWATSILASPSPGAWIDRLAVRKDLAIGGADTLYVGGYFGGVGGVGANSIAKTNAGGFAWSNVGGNTNVSCRALHVRTVGATGTTVTAGFGFPSAAWQFSSATGTWTQLGNPPATSIELYGGSYHATQSVLPVTSNPACVRYNGASWVAVVGQGLVGEVRALAVVGDDVVVGGAFGPSSTLPLQSIARWNGTSFAALGSGVSGGVGGSSVDALLQRSTGELVAGGAFTAAGGAPAANIARWNGSAWSPFGSGTDQQVLALCELPNGDLIAGGKFTQAGGVTCNRIARWNGSSWSSLAIGFNGDVTALAVRSDGVLFAAGAFTFAGATPCSRIARWDGLQWQPLGSGTNGTVHALAFRPNGDLIAAGAFAQAGGVVVDRCARWDGVAWTSTGAASGDSTPARSLLVLPNGDVVAGRGFHQPTAAPDAGIARWNGSTWAGIGAGLASSPAGSSVGVRAFAQRRDGTIFVGGSFGLAGGGLVARGLATLTPSCPAVATTVGVGCSSAAGPLSLTADTLPWAGGTLRTTTAGVPATALCVGVAGFTPLAIPLPALLPEGQAGCSLLASLDVLTFVPNGPGDTAQSGFVVPNTASLVGVSFLQQSVPFEFGVGGAIAAVRSSNALMLTIGAL